MACGTYPVCSATSRENRGSLATSLIAIGWPDCTTQPAMPWEDGIRMPVTSSAPSPAAIV